MTEAVLPSPSTASRDTATNDFVEYPQFVLSDKLEESSHSFSAHLSPELRVVQGHFPGNPIVPGFAQLEWLELCLRKGGIELLSNSKDHPISFKKVKFLTPMAVPCEIVLTFTKGRGKNELRFKYTSQSHTFTQGVLQLGE